MKRYSVILVSLVLIMGLLLGACGESSPAPTSQAPAPTQVQSTPTPPAQVKTIKFAYTMPKGASVGAAFEWFSPEFEKRTNGRYKVENYPSQSLIKLAATMDSVKTGAVEMAYTSIGTFPKQFPLTLVNGLPTMGFPGDDTTGYSCFQEFYDTFPEIQNEFKDVVLLNPMLLDPYNLLSKKKEFKKAEDFKGAKIGGTGAKMEIVKHYGGAHVQMVPPDSYLNLDKGVIDAGFLTFAQVRDYKLHEICKFVTTQDFGCGGGIVIMNKEFFNSMSPEDQKLIKDMWVESRPYSVAGAKEGIDAGRKLMQEANNTIYDPTPEEIAAWEIAAEPAFAQWKADCKTAGVDDATIDKILQAWKDLRAKWLKNGG